MSDINRLSTGDLTKPLSAWRIARQPRWLLNDLAPMATAMRHPLVFVRGVILWAKVRQQGFTMLGCRRGRTLFRLADDVERRAIPGALVDCGVSNGGSTAIMAAAAPSRVVWAFDSFEGLPTPSTRDGTNAAAWAASCLGRKENVIEAFQRFAATTQLRIVKGWFEETLPAEPDKVGPIALLHADGDWYDSVRLTLETLYENLSPGGYVVIDDYSVWSGAHQAVDEFRAKRRVDAPLLRAEASAFVSVTKPLYLRRGGAASHKPVLPSATYGV